MPHLKPSVHKISKTQRDAAGGAPRYTPPDASVSVGERCALRDGVHGVAGESDSAGGDGGTPGSSRSPTVSIRTTTATCHKPSSIYMIDSRENVLEIHL